MSTPRPSEGISIRVVPLAVFALVLIVPFFNFEFTLYRSTLKLFVYETAATLLLGFLLWEWGGGRLEGGGWPAWWLFVPVGAWVAWGAVTSAWSPQGWLARGWVVQGLYGGLGAFGLAVLLRDGGHRRMFVAAGSAVALALALFMALYYGDPRATFLGDIDSLPGRDAGAAFLLLPTLVAAALLYRRAEGETESRYRAVIWLTVLLAVLVLAGVRTGVPAWRYGLGAGLLVLMWLLMPRWRLAAVALAAVLAALAAVREMGQAADAARYWEESGAARRAVLDAAEWRMVRRASLPRLLFGNGVGTFFLALDDPARGRPAWTYAVTHVAHGDEVVQHARRQLTEELFERGVAGIAIAIAAGLAWVVAGALACRRARDSLDSALGAGLAAFGVAIGVFACFSNGAIGFGSGMMFWVGLGLLGALSAEAGRPAGLGLSPEEEASRGEATPRLRPRRTAAAIAGIAALALAWCRLAAAPFWAEYCLREGQAEDESAQRLFAQKSLAERNLQDAATALATLPATAKDKIAKLQDLVREFQGKVESTTVEFQESAARTERYVRRAGRLSLGDRMWLNAQMRRALFEAKCGNPKGANERLERLTALCGPAIDFDLQRAACLVRLGRPAEAHDLCRRYARKNPFGAYCALFQPKKPFYRQWVAFISDERRRKNPQAAAWAKDLIAAATEGLRWLPSHYDLQLLRGDTRYRLAEDQAAAWAKGLAAAAREGSVPFLIRYCEIRHWLGEAQAARDDIMAASSFIENALKLVGDPFVRASLYCELANASFQWNREKAIAAAGQVFHQGMDPRDPRAGPVFQNAALILDRLQPPKGKAPSPKGPAPPKAKSDGKQTAPDAPKDTPRPVPGKATAPP